VDESPTAVLPAARHLDDSTDDLTAIADDATDERAAAVDALRDPRRIDPALLQRVLDGLRRL
jgi:hypothetical protein